MSLADLQAIIAVPEGADFAAAPEATQDVFLSLVVKWVKDGKGQGHMPGTVVHAGQRLVLAHLVTPGGDPVSAINGLLAQHSLPWTLLRLQDWKAAETYNDLGELVERTHTVYLADDISGWLITQYEYDDEGQQIPGSGYKDGPERWCHFQGTEPWADSST